MRYNPETKHEGGVMQVLMMLVGGLVLAFLVVYGAYSIYRDVIKRKEK